MCRYLFVLGRNQVIKYCVVLLWRSQELGPWTILPSLYCILLFVCMQTTTKYFPEREYNRMIYSCIYIYVTNFIAVDIPPESSCFPAWDFPWFNGVSSIAFMYKHIPGSIHYNIVICYTYSVIDGDQSKHSTPHVATQTFVFSLDPYRTQTTSSQLAFRNTTTILYPRGISVQ